MHVSRLSTWTSIALLACVASACASPVGTKFAEDMCAGATYGGCVDGVAKAVDAGWKLFAICEFANGGGDVVRLDKSADAGNKCSGGGRIVPSKVFSVVTR
jgi:hypothetical protein